jgi:hypothetical protein
MACGTIERSTAEKANHRHRRLLRARRERPRSRRAAEQRMNSRRFIRSTRRRGRTGAVAR